MQIGFFNTADNIAELLGNLPENTDLGSNFDAREHVFVLAFIENRKMLETYLPTLRETITEDGALWLTYHKGTSDIDTDINRFSIVYYSRSMNLKEVAIGSIDTNWYGLGLKKV